MAEFKVRLRLKHLKPMERIQVSVPVNRQARMGISHKEYEEISSRGNRHEFLGRRPVEERPRTTGLPRDAGHNFTGMSIGGLVVVGWLPVAERRRLGWSGHWLVRCRCGNFESRTSHSLRKPHKREYGDACTFCKNAWAEAVMVEFRKTGRIPPGGLPTHRASHIERRRK